MFQLCELPIRGGVESLPDHHLLRSLIETIESRAPRFCDECSASSATTSLLDQRQQQQQQQGERKKTTEKKWKKRGRRSSHCCLKCEEFLCETCASDHRLQRATADHLVVSICAMRQLCQVPSVVSDCFTVWQVRIPTSVCIANLTYCAFLAVSNICLLFLVKYFYPSDDRLARICCHRLLVCVCASVRSSQAGIVLKRLNVGFQKQRRTIAEGF